MKYVYSIILSLVIVNCSATNNKKMNSMIIKYYRNIGEICPSVLLDDKHISYNLISDKQAKKEMNNLGRNGFPLQNIYKVYFLDRQRYEKNIPIKTEVYYDSPTYYGLWKYDKKGRVKEYSTTEHNGIYTYTNNSKEIKEQDKTTGQTVLMKYLYDKNKNFIKETTFINKMFYSKSILSKTNKNILYEYDKKGKKISERDITIPCYNYVD